MAKISTIALEIGVIDLGFIALGNVVDGSLGVIQATFGAFFCLVIVKLKISDSGEKGIQTEGIILVDPIYGL